MPRTTVQDASQLACVSGLLSGLLNHSLDSPAMVCSLISTGLLAMAIECASRLAAVQGPQHLETVSAHACMQLRPGWLLERYVICAACT